MTSTLFSPIAMRAVTFPNRIMVSPMGQCSAVDGVMNDWHLMHLGSMAVSGAGAVCIEATAVVPRGLNCPSDSGLWNDEQRDALGRIVEFCRRHSNARFGLQLWHAGRKGSVTTPWQRQTPIAIADGGWQVQGPSAIPYPGRHLPEAMTLDDIGRLQDAYAAATRRARDLDLDFLEIHCAHGYLLHSFLSPLANQRTDAYGGSLENRMRLPLEVYERIRAAWPEGKPIGVRISASDWMDDGWTLDESVELARRLRARGCDYITASSGGLHPGQKIAIGPGYQVPFAQRIREEAGLPTVAVGLITEPRQAEALLASGKADMVALGRAMLFNARWPWHAALELGEEPDFPPQYERAHPKMRVMDFLKPKFDR